MNYILHLVIYFNIYAMMAMSLNLVVGYCGLMSLAHAGYFAIGAYTYALATLKLGWSFIPALALGMLIAAILSSLMSLASLRFKGDLFVMISLAVQSLLFSLFQNWSDSNADLGTWKNLTNGTFGIINIPKPNLFNMQITDIPSICILSTAIAGLCFLIFWMFVSSPWGRLLKSIRDDELVAKGLGKSTHIIKFQVFFISCTIAALSGTVYSSYINYIDPSSASLEQSVLMLCMVMVGGVGNFLGPLVGVILLIGIPELLRFVAIPDILAANIRLIIYGILLILMMQFRPQGIAGDYRVK